ncbi:MAG: efflux RND transporter periplasmic adaptor subunit [Deltaproteobacteria bacterium]|nr:efflux RND transporter periplasmic adaptor subunit [Deltaproteobacteria bacterium]
MPRDSLTPLKDILKLDQPRPKGRGVMWIILLLVILGGVAVADHFYNDMRLSRKLIESARHTYAQLRKQPTSEAPGSKPAGEKKVLYWQDPMNPAHKSDKPGKAPDGMDLIPIYADESPAISSPKSAGEKKVLYWQDPMNPAHKSDKPGKAPDGMDLVPIYADEGGDNEKLPPGALRISPRKQQLIGVQLGEVTEQKLTKTIRSVGRLAYDETKIKRIQTRVDGWITRVYVDFTGKLVKKGQPLISFYSPSLVSTGQELLIAKKSKDALADSPYKEFGQSTQDLYASAKKRLKLWNVSDAQIREIEKQGNPLTTLTLFSPSGGFVVARNAFEGQRIAPETELYTLADLSTIWLLADVYEYELPLIQMGQPGVMTLLAFPNKVFTGKVTYIYPEVDKATRTIKVRLEFPNPNFLLKPDMYANVVFSIEYGRQTVVPDSAVLDSGTEQLVFLAKEGGYFEPRRVRLGQKMDNFYQVLDGVKVGDRVVTSANFLIDSESKLKSAISEIAGEAPAETKERGSNGESQAVLPSQSRSEQTPVKLKSTGKMPPTGTHSRYESANQPRPEEKPAGHAGHDQQIPAELRPSSSHQPDQAAPMPTAAQEKAPDHSGHGHTSHE